MATLENRQIPTTKSKDKINCVVSPSATDEYGNINTYSPSNRIGCMDDIFTFSSLFPDTLPYTDDNNSVILLII